MVEDKFEPKKLTPRELTRLSAAERWRYRWTRYSYLANKMWNDTHLTLAKYFCVSGVLYLACGFFVLSIAGTRVYDFLCNVDCTAQCDAGSRDDLLICDKSECYQAAVNITIMEQASSPTQLLYSDLSDSSDDLVCLGLISSAMNPLQMMESLAADYEEDYSNMGPCTNFHCGVLLTARTDSDLFSSTSDGSDDNSCTNTKNQKSDDDATSCICNGEITPDFIPAGQTASIWQKCGLAPLTPAPTFAPTASPTAGAPDTRRLHDAIFEAPPAATPTPTPSASASGPWAALDDLSPPRQVEVDLSATADSAASSMSQEDFIKLLNSTLGPEARNLQDTPPPTTGPSTFPTNYKTEDWGLCFGLQQCTPGVRTRTVTCLDGEGNCAPPAPPNKERCIVDHCSNCTVMLSLTIVGWSYILQGFVALMVFCVFAMFESRSEERREDMMVHVHICLRPLGLVCKYLPSIVRIIVLGNFLQLSYLVVQSWVPTSFMEINPDCNDSLWLRVLSMLSFTIWVFQFGFGLIAKAYCRQEPWLYQPLRPGLLRPIWKVLGLLGP